MGLNWSTRRPLRDNEQDGAVLEWTGRRPNSMAPVDASRLRPMTCSPPVGYHANVCDGPRGPQFWIRTTPRIHLMSQPPQAFPDPFQQGDGGPVVVPVQVTVHADVGIHRQIGDEYPGHPERHRKHGGDLGY